MQEPSGGDHSDSGGSHDGMNDLRRFIEAQALLASIVESSEDAIVSKTLEGIILSWNAGAQRLFGYTPEEAIGRPVSMLIPPDRLDEEVSILSRLRRGERIEHFETIRITKDKRFIDISLTISPVRDNSGRIVAASKVAREITRRKEAERALVQIKDQLANQLADLKRLHEMNTRLSTTLDLEPILQETLRTATVIEGTSYGFISLRDDEGKLYVKSSVGFDHDMLHFIDHLAKGSGARGRCFETKQRVIVEDVETDPLFAELREASRTAGIRAVHATPLVTRTGKMLGVLSTHFATPHLPSDREIHLIDLCAQQAVDYIENARLYSELREADRRKDEFLATLAHELRNPLAPISNSLQLLKMSEDLSPTVERLREIMDRQVNHMVRLVDDLLEVSRITRGKIDLRKVPVELATVIASAVETSRPLIDADRHQLAIQVPTEPMTLDADAVRLAQVVSNLLNNAAKYTEPGGQIWLHARREGGEAVVSVRDSGAGISAEMVPRVFEMFTQVDRTLNRSQGGLGIGLTLAKSLVQMHGGKIEAHSAGLGKGSEFIIRLPLVQLAKAAPPTSASGVAAATNTAATKTGTALQQRKILIVDDTHAAAYMLGKLLEMMGQQVRTAPGGDEALELIAQEMPEVIISDIGMPKMDGYELAKRIRALSGGSQVVLVALTGFGQDADKARAFAAGFNRHLVKPVGLETLEELLKSLPAENVTIDRL